MVESVRYPSVSLSLTTRKITDSDKKIDH